MEMIISLIISIYIRESQLRPGYRYSHCRHNNVSVARVTTCTTRLRSRLDPTRSHTRLRSRIAGVSLIAQRQPSLFADLLLASFHGRFTNRRRWIPTEIGIGLFSGANITPALFFLLLDRVTIQHRRGARRFPTRRRTAWPLPQLNVEFDLLPDAAIEKWRFTVIRPWNRRFLRRRLRSLMFDYGLSL